MNFKYQNEMPHKLQIPHLWISEQTFASGKIEKGSSIWTPSSSIPKRKIAYTKRLATKHKFTFVWNIMNVPAEMILLGPSISELMDIHDRDT